MDLRRASYLGGDTGIGLGSQVSQLVALAVLDDLDHFIKERLRMKQYIRYMDDFILIHPDKAYLQYCRAEIEKKLAEIGLKLNHKTVLYPLRQGVKLLQWRFIVTESGKIIRKMDKKKPGKQRQKLKKLFAKEAAGEYAPGTARQSLASWCANAARGNTYHARRNMMQFYHRMEADHENRRIQEACQSGGDSECTEGGAHEHLEGRL